MTQNDDAGEGHRIYVLRRADKEEWTAKHAQMMRWPSGAYRLLEISCGTYQMGSPFSAGAARAFSRRVMSRKQSLC
jgi:hypothetical protein